MKRAMLCALPVLLAAVSVATFTASSSEAGRAGVRMYEPRFVDGYDKVRLAGTARGHDRVRIQRYTRSTQRWVTVTRVRVRADGRFTTKISAADRRRAFRAAAGPHRSERLVVPPAPKPKPEPEPQPVPQDACGPQPQKADGTYWSCTLAQDFSGTELDRSVWKPQTGLKQGSLSGMPCYIDDPAVISVHDGALHLSVRDAPAAIPCPGLNVLPSAHIAGMVSTYRLFSQQYGRFEARFKNTAANVPGLHEAFWLWPDDRYTNTWLWPASGEIDISETYSKHPDLSIPFLHYTAFDNWGPKPGLNTAWNCKALRGEYNTYTLEWTATRIEILVNGKTCLVNTSGDPAFQKPYIVALTQGLGAAGNEYNPRTPLPATMTVDYVRVWK
jgi:beta-glucanase (GH16 family)